MSPELKPGQSIDEYLRERSNALSDKLFDMIIGYPMISVISTLACALAATIEHEGFTPEERQGFIEQSMKVLQDININGSACPCTSQNDLN
jgi:hypothetical protein